MKIEENDLEQYVQYSFDPSCISQFFVNNLCENIYNVFKEDKDLDNDFKKKFIHLFFSKSDLTKSQIGRFLSLSQQQLSQFLNDKKRKRDEQQSIINLKLEHAMNWLDLNTFNHYQYYHIASYHLSIMFEKYIRETYELIRAGKRSFKKSWNILGVKLSKHHAIDLYTCPKCGHGTDITLEQHIINLQKEYSNQDTFPY